MKNARRTALGFLVFFLFFSLFFTILEFVGIEVPSVRVIDKILALVALFLFLWSVDFSEVFFGIKSRVVDKTIVIMTYVFSLLFILQALQFTAREQYYLSLPLQYLVILLGGTRLFVLGGIILLLLTVYLAIKLPVKSPSFLSVLGEEGHAKGLEIVKRFLISFFVILGIYQLILKPTLEWLTLSTGSLLGHLIAIYILIDLIMHHQFNFKKFVLNLDEIIHDYYKKFIELFHSGKKFLFGISLLIVIIPVVDIGHFVLGYLTNKPNAFYSLLASSPGHTSWLFLMLGELPQLVFWDQVFLVLGYAANAIALIMLLLLPLLLWTKVFNKQSLELPKSAVLIYIFTVITAISAPAFKLLSITDQALFVGTDIQTLSLFSQPVGIALGVALVITIIAAFFYDRFPRGLSALVIIPTLVFFLRYIMLYYQSVWTYLVNAINTAVGLSAILFGALLLVSMVFSIGAVFVYLRELWQQWISY